MNYELAKKLKEAGFPWNWPNFSDKSLSELSDKESRRYVDWIASPLPTLEELIEACPKEYEGEPFVLTCYAEEGGSWKAGYGVADFHLTWLKSTGNTMSEAVANLWLKLHENS